MLAKTTNQKARTVPPALPRPWTFDPKLLLFLLLLLAALYFIKLA
jgi:hypothetical protein